MFTWCIVPALPSTTGPTVTSQWLHTPTGPCCRRRMTCCNGRQRKGCQRLALNGCASTCTNCLDRATCSPSLSTSWRESLNKSRGMTTTSTCAPTINAPDILGPSLSARNGCSMQTMFVLCAALASGFAPLAQVTKTCSPRPPLFTSGLRTSFAISSLATPTGAQTWGRGTMGRVRRLLSWHITSLWGGANERGDSCHH